MATIIVGESENLEKALKRFKRMTENEGIVKEYKDLRYFTKPSAELHQKKTSLARKLLIKRKKAVRKSAY